MVSLIEALGLGGGGCNSVDDTPSRTLERQPAFKNTYTWKPRQTCSVAAFATRSAGMMGMPAAMGGAKARKGIAPANRVFGQSARYFSILQQSATPVGD